MRFGFAIPRFSDEEPRTALAHTYEICALAEELGFDFGAVGHHSFTPETGDISAPFVYLAGIAARTSKLRLATSIYLISLHHPVVVAEQAATLDQMSGGRLIFGVGVGYRDYEFNALQIDAKRRGARADEAMSAIRSAWAAGRWAHRGANWSIEDVPVHPMPVQTPQPPMWVGGASDAALRRAAKLGDGWMSDNILDMDEEKERADTYRRLCGEAGRPAGAVCILRNAWVAPTREAAAQATMPALRRFLSLYKRAGADLPFNKPVLSRIANGEPTPIESYARGQALCGTPDDVIAEAILWRRSVGVDYFELMPMGPTDYQSLRAMLTLFGKEIIPAVRAEIGARA